MFLANVVRESGVVPIPQPIDCNDPQAPENSWNLAPDVLRLTPILLTVMVWSVEVVTKRYQTSSSALPVQGATATPELVAFCTVPAVLTHEVAEVSRTAAAQLSFAGCPYTLVERLIQSINKKNLNTKMHVGKDSFIHSYLL